MSQTEWISWQTDCRSGSVKASTFPGTIFPFPALILAFSYGFRLGLHPANGMSYCGHVGDTGTDSRSRPAFATGGTPPALAGGAALSRDAGAGRLRTSRFQMFPASAIAGQARNAGKFSAQFPSRR